MKVVTLSQFETNFDQIMDDVTENKHIYRIQYEAGDVMLVPFDCYEVLKDTYDQWVEEPQNEPVEGFDPYPLPMQYVMSAETGTV